MSRENEQNDAQYSDENSERQQTDSPDITAETVGDDATNEVHHSTSSLVDKLFGDFIYAWKSVSMIYKIALAIVIIALVAKIRYRVANGTKLLLLALLVATVIEYFEAKKLNESNGSSSSTDGSSGSSDNGSKSSASSESVSESSQSAEDSTTETTETIANSETAGSVESTDTAETPMSATAATVADDESNIADEAIDNAVNHETNDEVDQA